MGQERTETTPLHGLEHGSKTTSGSTFNIDNENAPEASASASAPASASSSGTTDRFVTIAVGGLACLTYITLSAAMILFNKYLMRADVFPFPVTLTSLHMLCSLSLGLILQRLVPSLFPAYSRVFCKKCSDLEQIDDQARQLFQTMKALLPFAPIAVCGGVCLVTGNAAYKYASVSFLQVVKESHVMIVYVFMLLAGLDKFKFRMAGVLLFVSCAAMVAVYGEMYFSWWGLSLQMVSGLAGSGQIVLNSLLMSRSSYGKIDPLTLVLCTAPVMLIALIPANAVLWDASIPLLMRQWAPYLVANAFLAFALQVSAATLIWLATGTGYALASVTKDVIIVAAAQVILKESFTSVQIIGFASCVLGLCLYSGMKLFPEFFEIVD